MDLEHTDRPGHAAELAERAARDGVERVVAVGGDGTVHEVANGLLAGGARAALGVVPVGSGNDFAKLVGTYRHGVERAAAVVAAARPRSFDAGRALGEWFVNSLGFGFGPHVVRVRNSMPGLRGFASYLVPIVRAFFSFEPPTLQIDAPELSVRGPIMLVEVCNGTTAGGSYRFAPDADPADGLLDVCVVRRVGLGRFLRALPRVMRGTHGTLPECTLFRTPALAVHAPTGPLSVHLDGELREAADGRCRIGIERGVLNVLVAR